MEEVLKNLNNVKDLKKLNIKEKEKLAEELRTMVLGIVSENGGHLASNLGVVELTIALHSVFNTPRDSIIWDVGHQTYVHKILTGRKDQMNSLRKLDGIAGFPKTSESEFDCFNTGHSSTSISAALGMARANKLDDRKNKVIDNYYMPESYDIDIIEKMLDIYNEAIKVYNCKLLIIDESGKTILFVTHNVADVMENCNRAIILSSGEKIYDGEVKEGVDKYKKLITFFLSCFFLDFQSYFCLFV